MPRDKQGDLPPKPYPNFPLFAHRGGSWKKKIGGKQLSFGPWRWPDTKAYEASWKKALSKYNDDLEAKALGLEQAERPELQSVGYLIDAHLTAQEDRVGTDIEPRTFAERRTILNAFRKAVGDDTTIAELEATPVLLTEYLAELDGRYGFHRYNHHVKEIKFAFKAAENALTGVLGRPFRLASLLIRKRDKVRRREKRLRAAERGKHRWLPDELRALFEFAPQPLRAMLGLAYFAGFGNSDCADLPRTAIDFRPAKHLGLTDGWAVLNWIRPKTEIDRAAVLPASVAKDLVAAIAARPKPAERKWSTLVFLTPPHPYLKTVRGGLPYVRDIVHEDENGSILKNVPVDVVQKEFDRLRDRLSHCPTHGWLSRPADSRGRGFRSDRKGLPRIRKAKHVAYAACPDCGEACTPMRKLGFYTFRHTATTYAIPAASLEARVLFEGHAIEGVRSNYVEELDTAELIKIAVRLQEKMDEPMHSDAPPSAASAA